MIYPSTSAGLSEVDDIMLRAFAIREREKIPTNKLDVQEKGWASMKDTAENWGCPELDMLDTRIKNELGSAVYPRRDYWFVFVDRGGSIDWHDHHQADLALVYHPRIRETGCGGALKFESDGSVATMPLVAGNFMAFDAEERHCVREHEGSFPRFSISCNLYR